MGWFSVGYGDEIDRSAVMRSAVESRAALLRAELARVEALLKEKGDQGAPKAERTEAK